MQIAFTALLYFSRISYAIMSHFVPLITFNPTAVCNDVMNMKLRHTRPCPVKADAAAACGKCVATQRGAIPVTGR
jgi:hypothetical protein